MSCIIIHLTFRTWSVHNTADESVQTHLRGTAYLGDSRIAGAALATALPITGANVEAWEEALQSLKGFYAIIRQETNRVIVAVDCVRSIPLFYGKKDEKIFLSDDAEWVRQQVGDNEMDPVARKEFQQAGYVTGPDTLFPHVKQLQAGEFLVAEKNNQEVAIRACRYYCFLHSEPINYDQSTLCQHLDQAINASIHRLINYAHGRQIVIPLSGGYDSRLIATMLKKFGYENVLCFSYGVPDNAEAQVSKRIAESLGYKWVFVEYSNQIWAEEWKSHQAKKYRQIASGHTSLPHVQDWLAVKRLVDQGDIKENAVLAPGHSGDFVAGSHIPAIAFTKKKHQPCVLADSIVKKHFSNKPFDKDLILYTKIRKRIEASMPYSFDNTSILLADLFEFWDWQERQAKYIVNSVRVYEAFSLDWWLPLWDLEFIRFWQGVPLVLREERRWYVDYVTEIYYQQSNITRLGIPGNPSDLPKPIKKIRDILLWMPRFISDPIRNLRREVVLKSHFLAFGGLVNSEQLKSYTSQGFNIIGIYSDLYLRDIWGE